MSNNNYHKQVALLISVIPEIALEPRFALHGGTAINLLIEICQDYRWTLTLHIFQ